MKHTPAKSKMLASHGYENGVMEVRYHNGKTFSHPGVPPELYQQFTEADSKGAFFNKAILHAKDQHGNKLYPGKAIES